MIACWVAMAYSRLKDSPLLVKHRFQESFHLSVENSRQTGIGATGSIF